MGNPSCLKHELENWRIEPHTKMNHIKILDSGFKNQEASLFLGKDGMRSCTFNAFWTVRRILKIVFSLSLLGLQGSELQKSRPERCYSSCLFGGIFNKVTKTVI